MNALLCVRSLVLLGADFLLTYITANKGEVNDRKLICIIRFPESSSLACIHL